MAFNTTTIWHFDAGEWGPSTPSPQFFEQYSHEPYIAVARYWRHFMSEEVRADACLTRQLDDKMAKGRHALDVMERHLSENRFFVADTFGAADIALYAYTHVAQEGGFDLGPYPDIRAWLDRVAAQPGHALITREDFEEA